MGTETKKIIFNEESFAKFQKKIETETQQLLDFAKDGKFESGKQIIGQEVEACLVDSKYLPLPMNERFLRALNDYRVTQEIARFNIEFNFDPAVWEPGVLHKISRQYTDIIQKSFNLAEQYDAKLLMAGILPTVSPCDLGVNMLSDSYRYNAFIERFHMWNKSQFNSVEIKENDGLQIGLGSLVFEGITTSQQAHLQIDEPKSATYYNCAQILAGPLLALATNSPLFFGCQLWAETRIPVFEQILQPRFNVEGKVKNGQRDYFGIGYVENSMLELYVHNQDFYAHALPEVEDEPEHQFFHLNLHNGTIWRWNRPVIGINKDGSVHMRIEHRYFPSGPTVHDMIANLGMLIGTTIGLAEGQLQGTKGSDIEKMLPFSKAKANFYSCARDGLTAEVTWLDGKVWQVNKLLAEVLLPLANDIFVNQDMTDGDMNFLATLDERLASGRTGSQWQLDYMEFHGGGSTVLNKLAAAYWRRQIQGLPVHKWTI